MKLRMNCIRATIIVGHFDAQVDARSGRWQVVRPAGQMVRFTDPAVARYSCAVTSSTLSLLPRSSIPCGRHCSVTERHESAQPCGGTPQFILTSTDEKKKENLYANEASKVQTMRLMSPMQIHGLGDRKATAHLEWSRWELKPAVDVTLTCWTFWTLKGARQSDDMTWPSPLVHVSTKSDDSSAGAIQSEYRSEKLRLSTESSSIVSDLTWLTTALCKLGGFWRKIREKNSQMASIYVQFLRNFGIR